MSNTVHATGCCCHNEQQVPANKLLQNTKKTTKTIPSILLSVLIAFFPKCPVCWAAYMSVLGGVGIEKLPYMSWLLPVFLCFLAFYLYMVYRKASKSRYYVPLFFSLAGAVIIVCGRTFFPAYEWVLVTGLAMIVAGSVLNNLPVLRLRFLM